MIPWSFGEVNLVELVILKESLMAIILEETIIQGVFHYGWPEEVQKAVFHMEVLMS